jgi:hypothetical protein
VGEDVGSLWFVLNPEQSGFQPTVEPTGFQPVVVQFNLWFIIFLYQVDDFAITSICATVRHSGAAQGAVLQGLSVASELSVAPGKAAVATCGVERGRARSVEQSMRRPGHILSASSEERSPRNRALNRRRQSNGSVLCVGRVIPHGRARRDTTV